MKSKSKNLIEASRYITEHPGESISSIAAKFKIDRHSLPVKDFEKYIDGADNRAYYFSPTELEIIAYWQEHPNINFPELKQIFGQPSKLDTLTRWLRALGLSTERHYQISYNRNAFSEIQTEEDAYWLGFLLADGYISTDRNLVQIKLGEKDIEHLKKFLKYLDYSDIDKHIKKGAGGAYTKDNVCVVVKVNGEQIVQNLVNYGLFQAKSGKEIPYKCSSVELEKAYIRGIIDGDGYLRTTEDGFGVVGSYEVVNYIKEYIHTNICDMSNVNITPHGEIFKLATNGINKTSLIISHFYKNATIYLDRKYSIYQEKYAIE